MFDFGWQEFLMVGVVLMLVVGPKDMPRILRGFSQFMRKARAMANEFTSTLEDAARDSDIKSMMQDVKSGEFDEMANLIGGDVKELKDDLSEAAGLDEMSRDVKDIADSQKSPPKTAQKAKKAATKTKPKTGTAKKTRSKKAAGKAKTAAKKKSRS